MNELAYFTFVVEKINEIISEPIRGLSKDSNWFELGMDSIEMMGLAGAIESEFAVEISEDILLAHETVGSLSSYIYSQCLQKDAAVNE